MDPMLDFTGKVALITGAASGFGKLLGQILRQFALGHQLGDLFDGGRGQRDGLLARNCEHGSDSVLFVLI